MDWTLLVAVFGYAFTVSKKCVQKYKKIKVSGYRHRAAGTSCKKKNWFTVSGFLFVKTGYKFSL